MLINGYQHGVIYNTDKEKVIKGYVDSYFPGGCAKVDANIAENVMPHMGYVIT